MCEAAAAEQAFQSDHPDLDPGTIVGSYLLPEGEQPVDPLEFDPARAALEAEALAERRRRGLV